MPCSSSLAGIFQVALSALPVQRSAPFNPTDFVNRSDNELLAQSWRPLARSYQFVESLQRFFIRNGPQQENRPSA